MKTAFRSAYGSEKVLSIKEVEIPTPGDSDVLIKVHATTVNRSDIHVLTGKPCPMQLLTGMFKPRLSTTGSDFAGEVVAVGKTVTAFKAGDRIMGFRGFGIGSHVQYLLLPEAKAIRVSVNIPDGLSYEEAAACIEGAFYAAGISFLKLEPGQKALVNGATGAIGTSYVQILRSYGVSVTAVCRGEHSELVRSLGADKVIDYTKDDFTKDADRYDFVLDAVGKTSFLRCKRLLKKHGIYASSGGAENILLNFITPLFGGKKVVFKTFRSITAGLNFIKGLIEKGSFRAVIDRKYPLDNIADAFKYVASGQKVGNVVITMFP